MAGQQSQATRDAIRKQRISKIRSIQVKPTSSKTRIPITEGYSSKTGGERDLSIKGRQIVTSPAQQKTQVKEIQQERALPTVATPEAPVKSIATPTTPQVNFAELSDRDKKIQIALDQIKNAGGIPGLTEEQTKYMVSQYFPEAQTVEQSQYQPVIETIQGQIAQREEEKRTKEAQLEAERESILQEKKDEQATNRAEQMALLRQQGLAQKQGVQEALSFSGFGRSTEVARLQSQIQVGLDKTEQSLLEADQLSLDLYERELRGEDAATLAEDQAYIDQLRQEARQYEIVAAQEVAAANEQNGVTGMEAISNIIAALPQRTQGKIDESVSNLVGYISDEFGNPVITDDQGNPVQVTKDQEATKWERYEDENGNVYFYDPSDPLGTYTKAPGSTISVYQDPEGNYVSSETTSITGIGDVTEQVRNTLGEEYAQWANNCAEFVRMFVPNMPGGNYNKQARISNIQKAKDGGFGSDDMNLVQVGDAIMTGEGDVGHSAMVIARDGDTLTLLEANYQTGKITQGRTININDPLIYGWVRPTEGAVSAGETEKATPSMQNQLISGVEGTKISDEDSLIAKSIVKKVYGTLDEDAVKQVETLIAQGASEQDIYNLLGVEQEADKEYDTDTFIDLRTKYVNESKTFNDVQDAYNRIQSTSDTPAGDLSLIFSYMKLLDPGSVVREGEQATASNAAGVPDRIRNMYNKIQSGEKLTASQRSDFRTQASKLFKNYVKKQKSINSTYQKLAEQEGIPPEDLLYDLSSYEFSDLKAGSSLFGESQDIIWSQL